METALTPAGRARARTAARSLLAAVLPAAILVAAPAGAAPLRAARSSPPATPATSAARLEEAQQVLFEKLRQRIQAVDARLDGVLGVSIVDLTTGARVEIRADHVFPAASTIKLAVLYELYRQGDEGRIDLLALVAPPANPAPSAGILRSLRPPSQLSLRDLGLLVMALSDNEAANELMRRVGLEAVNRRLDTLGLRATRLRRLMMDLEAARAGRENVSTPRELAELARLVGSGRGLRAASAADLLAVASTPDPGSSFRAALPEELRAVSKPGALEGVRCETAWVDVPGRPYAAAVMTSYLRRDRDGEAAIAEVSAAAYETFDRLGRSSPQGRVISGR